VNDLGPAESGEHGDVDTPADVAVRADLEQILANARSQVARASLGAGVSRLGRTLLRNAAQATDYGDLQKRLDGPEHELLTLATILRQARQEAEKNERKASVKEPFGEVGWSQRQRTLAEALRADPDRGTQEWVAAYAEALAADRADICLRLTDWQQSAVPSDKELTGELHAGACAISERRFADALSMLRMLTDAPIAAAVTTADRVAILVTLGRVLLRLGIGDEVKPTLERAEREAAGVSHVKRAVLEAAFGELALREGENDTAAYRFDQAIQLAPDHPAGYVGYGLLAERREEWYQAEDWYDKAVAVAGDDDATFMRLLVPAPANLYWRLARRLRSKGTRLAQERALQAIERAFEIGVTGAGNHPERRAIAERGRILEALQRPAEAAAAYYRAGNLSSMEGDQVTAHRHVDRACRLDGSIPLYHWELAEILRLLAFQPDGSVDPDRMHQAHVRWEKGPGRPDINTAWAYLTRALINLRLGDQRPLRELAWEATTFLERALLLRPGYGWALAYLGMIHRGLGNCQVALEVTARAVASDPTDSVALRERSAALAAAGDYDRAEQVLDGMQDLSGPSLAYAKAFLRLGAGKPQEALELVEAASVEDASVEEELEHRWVRTWCYESLGRPEEARPDYRWIWERSQRNPEMRPGLTEAWAAYALGEYDAAERIYRARLGTDLLEDPDVHVSLGLVLLARGDLDRGDLQEGTELLLRGIGLTTDRDALRYVAELNLPELSLWVRDRPHAPDVLQILQDVRADITERRHALVNTEASPEGEMRRALESLEPDRHESSQWTAALAALGRMAVEAERWSEALDCYVKLCTSDFEEALVGVRSAAQGLQEMADRLVGKGQHREAIDTYRQLAGAVATFPGKPRLSAGLNVRIGLAALGEGDLATAREHLLAAVDDTAFQEALVDSETLASAFVREGAEFWTYTDRLTALVGARELTPAQRSGLEAIRSLLSLSAIFGLRRKDLDPAATFPLTNPLVLKLGDSLALQLAESGPVPLSELLRRVRERVEQETGARPPGVRVSRAGVLAPDSYQILLDGVKVASGEVNDACLAADLDQMESRLESALRDNLAHLLGIDDVRNWLAGWALDRKALSVSEPDLDRASRVRLHRMLRLLLREGVPITDRQAIIGALADLADLPGGAAGALRAARRRLRPYLPGNEPDTPRASLPPALEASIAASLQEADAAMGERPRTEVNKLVDELRIWAQEAGPAAAVVVGNPDLRPVVWHLLSGVLPRRAVLAEEEADGRA
jgi:tetratricopeptide (TPR) repeat protein